MSCSPRSWELVNDANQKARSLIGSFATLVRAGRWKQTHGTQNSLWSNLGSQTKGVVMPGISGSEDADTEDDGDLEGEDATRYRGVIARCNYLSTDRPDCLFAIKEGCREMR